MHVCATMYVCVLSVVHMPVWAYTFIPEVNLCCHYQCLCLSFLTLEIWLGWLAKVLAPSILLSPSLPPPMRLQTCARVFHGGSKFRIPRLCPGSMFLFITQVLAWAFSLQSSSSSLPLSPSNNLYVPKTHYNYFLLKICYTAYKQP